MATGVNDILLTLNNLAQAVNNIRGTLSSVFPQATTVSTAARGSVGAVTFTSSLAVGFLAVTTSSGFTGYVALYPSS